MDIPFRIEICVGKQIAIGSHATRMNVEKFVYISRRKYWYFKTMQHDAIMEQPSDPLLYPVYPAVSRVDFHRDDNLPHKMTHDLRENEGGARRRKRKGGARSFMREGISRGSLIFSRGRKTLVFGIRIDLNLNVSRFVFTQIAHYAVADERLPPRNTHTAWFKFLEREREDILQRSPAAGSNRSRIRVIPDAEVAGKREAANSRCKCVFRVYTRSETFFLHARARARIAIILTARRELSWLESINARQCRTMYYYFPTITPAIPRQSH